MSITNMYDELWNKNIDDLKIKDMKKLLYDIGSTYCLKSRSDYVNRISTYKKCILFPWRKEQKDVLDIFNKFKHKNYVIHAIFGSGKTTLLLGLLINGVINRVFSPEEVMFISFNISIKNEIKRKLKDYGISSKVTVRTFDSIIYEIAKIGKYPYIDLPNFEGKRKFVYELCFNKEFTHIPAYQPKVIFIDECQDLEYQTLIILKHFYPDSKYVFAGDIFQSIQKEPRESVLWYFMKLDESPDTYKIYMSETPRVPKNTLNTLQTALKTYYPEFKDKINNWTSSNCVSSADIEWKRFNSYSHIYDELKDFLSIHGPKETMILTFSSAITVKGAMGDISRLRRFLSESGFNVNTNHKKQDPDTYFLSTANSSKGLERDYVIIFLTFPLERAFVHLSDDVVVNLITVALTRAKKKVLMYVPSYEDKYSRVLSLFQNCPTPNKTKIRDGKTIKEFVFQDYIDIEHCVTELIRASVIKYDTRIKIREFTKSFNFSKIFDDDISYKTAPIPTEEERTFVGVLIENLITSTWLGKWPDPHSHDIGKHPLYCHIINRIKNAENRYSQYIKSNIFDNKTHFDGIYLYSQLHVALSNKIFMKLSDSLTDSLRKYWNKLKPKTFLMKPSGGKLKIQVPVQMPWLTGIADASLTNDDNSIEIYEIKASQDNNWKDNALIQISCYALMTGKTWSRLHLINPFRNEKVSYYFNTKNILSLRKEILKDIFTYNTNAMMAKLYPTTKNNKPLSIENTLFVNIVKNEHGNITQASILNMLSPIKCEFVYDKYVASGLTKNKDMSKEERFACESIISKDDLIKELNNILSSDINKDKVVWVFDNYDEIKTYTNSIKHFTNINNFNDIVTFLNYNTEIEKQRYFADLSDSLIQNIFCLSFMFLKYHFV